MNEQAVHQYDDDDAISNLPSAPLGTLCAAAPPHKPPTSKPCRTKQACMQRRALEKDNKNYDAGLNMRPSVTLTLRCSPAPLQ